MSPARGKKAKSKSPKKTARPPRPATKPRSKAKSAAKPKAPAKKPGKPAKGAASTQRRHCAATDPFGDPCQSAPRMSSKYCTIHSYLDR